MSCVDNLTNCSDCNDLSIALRINCDLDQQMPLMDQFNISNCTQPGVNYERGVTAVIIFCLSLVGNISIIAILAKFKVHKIPDVLVIGLAVTDLVATLIPVPMSIYAYFVPYQFVCHEIPCDLYATVAQFTRYSSALIVTLVSIERYCAVIHPFFYRKHATPGRFIAILILCWIIAFSLAVVPALHSGTNIVPHEGFCLFDVASPYAYSIIAYSAIQYVIVFFCFVTVLVQLCLVYRRRKRLRVQDQYNKASKAKEREVTFTKPNLTARISDLSKSLKKAAPLMVEKFQFGIEAQFAGMLFVVVLLFYMSWTAILVVIIIAQIRMTGEGLETALFWGIRFSVISTAINPLLYGILARQYKLAYIYVFQLWLSKCFKCISPPLKDVFAAARGPGGDIRNSNAAGNRRRRFKEQGRTNGSASSQTQSLWGRATAGVPILMRSKTAKTQGDLEVIQEVDYVFSPTDSNMDDHSTFIPSVGDLVSSVIIPHQKRTRINSETEFNRLNIRPTASLDNLGDGLLSDFGPSNDPQLGVDNPIVGELNEDMSLSEQGSAELGGDADDTQFQFGRLYSNPVYQIELARRSQEEADIKRRAAMIAASSADDITLITKQPYLPLPSNTNNNTLPPELCSDYYNKLSLSLSKTSSQSSDVIGGNGDMNKKLETNESLNDEDLKQLEQLRKLQHKQSVISRSQDFVVDIDSSDYTRRSSLRIEPISSGGVHDLRIKFEASSTAHTSPISPLTHTTITSSHINGRHNSVGNSDSGRESMVLDTETAFRTDL